MHPALKDLRLATRGMIAVVGTAVLAGCGGGEKMAGPPPREPAVLQIQSGDSVRQFPGLATFERQSVRLVDAAGDPVRRGGVRVAWTVVTGGGVVTVTEDTTTSQGVATAVWSMGAAEGLNELRAEAQGLPPVTFRAWSVAPGPIVFVSGRSGFLGSEFEGYPGDLWVMKEDGSDVMPLFPPTQSIQVLTSPSWSPDGSKILYFRSSTRPAGGVPGLLPEGMWTMRLDSLKELQVPPGGIPFFVDFLRDPTWERTGIQIVAFLDAVGVQNIPAEVTPGQLHVMSSQGFGLTPIATPATTAREPSWSPVADELAFSCQVASTFDICAVDANGNNFRTLTSSATDDTDPQWSPDGARIAFTRGAAPGGSVWVMDADGTNATEVVTGAFAPAWSPDGTRLLVTIESGQRQDIYLVDLASGVMTNLTDSPFRDREAHWRN